MDKVDDRLDAEVEEPPERSCRRNPVPNSAAPAGRDATAPRSGRPKPEFGDQPDDPPPSDRSARSAHIRRASGRWRATGAVMKVSSMPVAHQNASGRDKALELRSFRERLPLHSATRERRLLGVRKRARSGRESPWRLHHAGGRGSGPPAAPR